VVACASYNVTTYIARKERKKDRRKVIRQCYLILSKGITMNLLSSDSFMEGKCPWVKLKKSDKVL